MFCKSCGKDIVGTKKCLYCGFSIENLIESDQNISEILPHIEEIVEEKTTNDNLYNENTSFTSSKEAVETWKKNSILSKISSIYSVIFVFAFLGIILLLVYSAMAMELDLPKLIDFNTIFNDKSDEDIFNILIDDGIKYITLFFGFMLYGAAITNVLGSFCIFDFAKWLEDKNIEYRNIVQSSSYDKMQVGFDNLLKASGAIKDNKKLKRIYYISMVGLIISSTITLFLLNSFIKTLITNIYVSVEILSASPKEILKSAFLNKDSLLFFGALIITGIFNAIIKSKLKKEQNIVLENTTTF